MRRRSFRAALGAVLLVLATAGHGQASPYSITVLDSNGGYLLPSSQWGLTLNNLGQVAGSWMPYSGTFAAAGQSTPYLYDPTAGGKVALPGITSPSGTSHGSYNFTGYATGLNDLGQFVYSSNSGGAFLLDTKTGQVTSLPGPAGLITNSGQVIGTEEVAPVSGWANPTFAGRN